MGMNATCPHEPIHLILRRAANCLLHELKQSTIYNVINPFPWMDSIVLSPPSKAKQTSLRNEWVNTQKVESILATSNKNVTCSLLMNSSKSMQQSPFYLFFSIYLPISMLTKLNLHCWRSWFLYMVLTYLAIIIARRYLAICLHYAPRWKKKGKDWCVEEIMISCLKWFKLICTSAFDINILLTLEFLKSTQYAFNIA
jgi:hypothetical protein